MIRRHLAVWLNHPRTLTTIVSAGLAAIASAVVWWSTTDAAWPGQLWAGHLAADRLALHDVTVAMFALGLLAVAPVAGLLAPSRRRLAPSRRPAAAPARMRAGRVRHSNSGRSRCAAEQLTHLPTVTYRTGRATVQPSPLFQAAGSPAAAGVAAAGTPGTGARAGRGCRPRSGFIPTIP